MNRQIAIVGTTEFLKDVLIFHNVIRETATTITTHYPRGQFPNEWNVSNWDKKTGLCIDPGITALKLRDYGRKTRQPKQKSFFAR